MYRFSRSLNTFLELVFSFDVQTLGSKCSIYYIRKKSCVEILQAYFCFNFFSSFSCARLKTNVIHIPGVTKNGKLNEKQRVTA